MQPFRLAPLFYRLARTENHTSWGEWIIVTSIHYLHPICNQTVNVMSLNTHLKLVSPAAIIVMMMWALCYPLIKLSLPFAPVMLTAFLRAILAGCVIVLIAHLTNRPFPKGCRLWAYITTIGLTATSLGLWGMFYAGSLIDPGLATVITNTQPLIAGILGWYFLKERMTTVPFIGTVIGFIGIVIISLNSPAHSEKQILLGIGFVLMASAGVAVSNVLLKKIAGQVDVLFAMGFQLLIGAIPLGVLAYYTTSPDSINWKMDYTLILLALALFGTALPFILWFWLMQQAPLFKLNVYNFLTPLFGIYLGHTYFSESLTTIQWLGATLIIIAIFLVTVINGKTKPQH